MTELLVRKFVKDYQAIEDSEVRGRYGFLSSMVGILCNILLFVMKLVVATMTGSIAIVSDAFNNLSDCASCVVTLFGYKMASKPADRDHPFGHGRMEYITSLAIAVMILLVAVELFKSSLEKVLHPEALSTSIFTMVILLSTVLIKLWMGAFNRKLGKRLQSGVMLATSQDSFNDALITSLTIAALVIYALTGWKLDGWVGFVVSFFVLMSGVNIIRDTLDELLGKPADKETVDQLKQIVLAPEEIIGFHDLMIHDYGPGRRIGSCHAEVRCDCDMMQVHDVIDQVEKEVEEKMNLLMTIHMDPVEVDNEEVTATKMMAVECLKEVDSRLSLHDFRMVAGPTHTNLVFDVVVPFEITICKEELKQQIDARIQARHPHYFTVITFDRGYI